MIKTLLNILLIGFPIFVSAQRDLDPISKITYPDSLSSFVINPKYHSQLYYYYINKKVISWTKAFICPESISRIGFLDSIQAKDLFGDSVNGTVITLETKPNFTLISFSKLLRQNKIDLANIHYSEVYINDQQVLDSATLANGFFDAKAQVEPIYKKEIGSGSFQKVAIGVFIYTKKKKP